MYLLSFGVKERVTPVATLSFGKASVCYWTLAPLLASASNGMGRDGIGWGTTTSTSTGCVSLAGSGLGSRTGRLGVKTTRSTHDPVCLDQPLFGGFIPPFNVSPCVCLNGCA